MKKRKKEFERKFREYKKFLRDDEDFDYHYIIRLLRFKLERTRDHIVKYNVIATKDIIKQIEQVIYLLKRVENENEVYDKEIFGEFEKKYGQLLIKSIPIDETRSEIIFRYEKETNENSAQIYREIKKLRTREVSAKHKDLDKALKLISKHIWGWWV